MFVRAYPSSFKRPPFSRRARKTHKQAHCWKDGKLAKAGGLSPRAPLPRARFWPLGRSRGGSRRAESKQELATLGFRMVEWFGAFWTRFPGLPSSSKQGNCDEQLKKAAPSKNPILAKWGFATAGWLGASWTRFPGLPSPSKQGNCDEQFKKAAPIKKHHFGEMGFCDGWLVRGSWTRFPRLTEPQYK